MSVSLQGTWRCIGQQQSWIWKCSSRWILQKGACEVMKVYYYLLRIKYYLFHVPSTEKQPNMFMFPIHFSYTLCLISPIKAPHYEKVHILLTDKQIKRWEFLFFYVGSMSIIILQFLGNGITRLIFEFIKIDTTLTLFFLPCLYSALGFLGARNARIHCISPLCQHFADKRYNEAEVCCCNHFHPSEMFEHYIALLSTRRSSIRMWWSFYSRSKRKEFLQTISNSSRFMQMSPLRCRIHSKLATRKPLWIMSCSIHRMSCWSGIMYV